MKVFLSWSGQSSRALATALHDWIPRVLQAIRPWMSANDLQAGVRWSAEVAQELADTSFGVICLTPDNLEAPWIMFEAGALSKVVQSARVVPYLLGVEPSQLQGPLSQFQAMRAVSADTLKLLRTLNAALGDRSLSDSQLEDSFEVWWPRLETGLPVILGSTRQSASPPRRSQEDLLTEILQLVRAQERRARQAEENAIKARQQVDLLRSHAEVDELLPGLGLDASAFRVGDHVEHPRFGAGTVLQVAGMGSERKVRVHFSEPEVGTKWLLEAFAKLVKQPRENA